MHIIASCKVHRFIKGISIIKNQSNKGSWRNVGKVCILICRNNFLDRSLIGHINTAANASIIKTIEWGIRSGKGIGLGKKIIHISLSRNIYKRSVHCWNWSIALFISFNPDKASICCIKVIVSCKKMFAVWLVSSKRRTVDLWSTDFNLRNSLVILFIMESISSRSFLAPPRQDNPQNINRPYRSFRRSHIARNFQHGASAI